MIKKPSDKLQMFRTLDCYVSFNGGTVGGRDKIPFAEYFKDELADIERALKRYERLGDKKFRRRKELDPLERSKKLEEFNNKALKIIHEKGLDFQEFMSSFNGYEYNICRNHIYKKLSAKEYLILKCVIKLEHEYLEVL